MASSWFFKFAFKCLDHFAWPLLALGYPLRASIQAIETDSYAETRNLISYWILLSLIYLFEHAFVRLLQWFQFWPYIKLMIIFWLIIPDFGRASYVYNHLICRCISMEQPSAICRLNNYWRKFFGEKDKFLPHAERYMKENGTEALEKLIVSKNTMMKPDGDATDAIRAIDYKEMQQINEDRLQTEHNGTKDSKQLKNTMNKPDEEATNAIKATDYKEMQLTNEKRVQKEHRDSKDLKQLKNTMNNSDEEAINAIKATNNKEMQPTNVKRLPTEHKDKDLEVVEKKEIPTGEQDIPVMPNLVPSENASSAIAGAKGLVGKDIAGGELPQSSTAKKEVQKEWTCALCQVTTACEKTLNSHLSGKKHRATCEALKAKNQPTLQKMKNPLQSKEKLKQKEILDRLKSSAMNGEESYVNKGLKGTAVMDHKVQKSQKSPSEPVGKKNSKFKCVLCNVILESEVTMASHFNGKKHLAKIRSLQNNRDTA